jgi:hypothetical protein
MIEVFTRRNVSRRFLIVVIIIYIDMESSREWYRDEFLISTSNKLLQPSAINAVFASDLLYWTKSMSEEGMKRMLSKSLCFGVYALPKTSSELAGMFTYPNHF